MDRELLLKKRVIAGHIDNLLAERYHPSVLKKIEGVKTWLESDSSNQLFFYGDKGTGKSFVAEVAVVEALKKNIPARRVVWSDLVAETQDNYGQISGKYQYDKILFIDNFKRIENKAYYVALSFLKSQHEEGKRLIIAMTATGMQDIPMDFRDMLGAVCMVINFKGDNLNRFELEEDRKKMFGGD